MNPIPPLSLVQNLALLDKDLRIRWGRHQAVWLIELKVKERQPAYLAEKPNPMGTTPRAKDWWESWVDGYAFVTKLAHPIVYPWDFIAAHLKHLSLEAHQGKAELLRRLDAAEAEDEAKAKREWARINETGAKEIYDRLAWDTKREISTYVGTSAPKEEARDGYVVVDRRVTA